MSDLKIKKAVFPVAGFGTRFLPATKAMPKELLPIVDKPLIQYAAEEAVSAGIDTLIFVTGRNKRAIEDHFDSNYELEEALKRKGKLAEARMINNILPEGVECIFVRQAEQLGLGHAVLCAERAVGQHPFAVILADDFLVQEGLGVTSELVDAFKKTGKHQISSMKVDRKDVFKYGIIKQDVNSGQVNGLVEKPNIDNAPSELASIGRYILSPKIFDVLRLIEKGINNEIQLADAINLEASKGSVEMVQFKGIRFDCGSIEGFLEATRYVGIK